MNLLKFLFPIFYLQPRIGDDGGGGDSGAYQEQEESRRADLRRRIDRLYGHRSEEPAVPDIFGFKPEAAQELERRRQATMAGANADADAAAGAMDKENTRLADATRAYYTDDLGRDYEKAERNTRFRLARQGLLGGSEDVYQQGELRSDRDLGATRVDEAVRRAISGLTSQREQERLNAMNLVNSGSGDSAVSAAAAGLRNSFENVASQQKADLFSDLFSHGADALTAGNLSDQQAALLARYRDRPSSFFPATSTTSGRVTPSA